MARGRRPAARSDALYGAWLAGWALGSTTMGLHHKLAHVLGGTFRLPHAGVHSALLPQVAAFNAPAAPAAFTLAAEALGVAGPDRVGPALFDLATRLAAPTSLAGLGLDPGAIEQVAATVAAVARGQPAPGHRSRARPPAAGRPRGNAPLTASGHPPDRREQPPQHRPPEERPMTDTPSDTTNRDLPGLEAARAAPA